MASLRNKFCALLAFGALAFGVNAAALAAPIVDYPVVKLRSLDKITARTQVFEAGVGKTIKFGSIYIKVQACRKAPELEKPENAAFLQVWEIPTNEENTDQDAEWIFSGWMFSSSPGLSAMDHPIYDVWVLDCMDRKGGAKAGAVDADTQPETDAPEAEDESAAESEDTAENTGD